MEQQKQAALLLDRDGVVVEEVEYLHKVEDMHLLPGVPEAIALAKQQGLRVILITNQAGIGRGYYTEKEFWTVQEALGLTLASHGATLDGVYFCPFHEKGKGAYAVANHPDRKPNPGMIQKAAQEFNLDLSRSAIVGDKLDDLKAGQNGGVGFGYLSMTGYGRGFLPQFHPEDYAPCVVRPAENLLEAVKQFLTTIPSLS